MRVPQEINRFGFMPNVDPIMAFCDATERLDPDNLFHDLTKDTPAGRLVHMIWSSYDAAAGIVVRHGDEVMKLCLATEIAVYDDTLHLGPLTIDLTSPGLQFAETSTAGFDFVLDGVSLRLACAGYLVDCTSAFAQDMCEHVLRIWKGEMSHVVVTRGGRTGTFGRDDIRVYPMGHREFAVRFGSLLMVRPDRGAIWCFKDGVSDGIDLDGVAVRIEVVPMPGHDASLSYPGPFDAPLPPQPVRAVPVRRGPEVRVDQVAPTGELVAPVRSNGGRRGLGRPGLMAA